MKKYSVLVLAMSTLPNPFNKNRITGNTAFDNRYVFSGEDSTNKNLYHGVGQLEPVPQYILDSFGALTHCVILQTPEVKEPIGFDLKEINKIINSENGDQAPIEYADGEQISAVSFFEKRIEAFYRKRAKEKKAPEFNNKPEFIHIDYSEDKPEDGLSNLLEKIRNLYSKCLQDNDEKNIDDCWQLFIDVHGGFRAAALAMFALIQTLSAPDEQDLKSGRDKNLDAALARLTDGKGTIPISHVYTVNYDPNNLDPKTKPHTIVDKTKFYQLFTRESLEAYMNYGQYAQIALKSAIELKNEDNPPYAFISYRRMDAPKERFTFLGVLKKEGYRYWYDDSIELQSNWKDTLEKANDKSTVFIALITKNYYDSYQCLKELRRALDAHRDIFLVSLDQKKLEPPKCDLTKDLKENILNDKGEIVGERIADTVTVYKDEVEAIIKKQHLTLKDLILDGVFQQSRLKDKLDDLCKNNETFRALKSN